MQAEEINPNLQNQPILVGQPVVHEPDVMLTKVNADIETKRHVFLHWCAFFILVSIFVISSVFMPESVIEAKWSNICQNISVIDQNQQALLLYDKFCNAADSEAIRPILIENLDDINQFLIVYGQFSFNQLFYFELTTFNYTATLFGLKKRQDQADLYQNIVADKFHSISINCLIDGNDEGDESDENDQSDESDESTNSTSGNRILQRGQGQDHQHNNEQQPQTSSSYKKVCDTQVLLYNPNLDYHSYLFVLNFTEMYNLGYYYQFQGFQAQLENIDVNYSIVTVNPAYSKSVIAVRYTFLAVSIILGVMFGCKMRALYRQNWVIEQRFVVVLSVLLPFFNDPLYAATLLQPNRVTSIIGVIFFSNFICALLLYWLVLFHRIVLENGTKDSTALTKPKIIICGLLWVFFVACYTILVMEYFRDPSATFDDLHKRAYLAFKVLSFTFTLGIFIYLLKYLIMFCKRYETRLWRYKLIGLFNIFFMMCLALFILSGSFEIYNLTGTEVVICISILNLYIYYQQYLWAPSKQGLSQQSTFTTIEQQMGIISNEGYDELRPDDININQENVVDEKFQVEDDKEVPVLN